MHTSLYRIGIHGYESDEQGADDVDDWKNEIDLDRSGQIWLCPPEPRHTENRDTDAQLQTRQIKQYDTVKEQFPDYPRIDATQLRRICNYVIYSNLEIAG